MFIFFCYCLVIAIIGFLFWFMENSLSSLGGCASNNKYYLKLEEIICKLEDIFNNFFDRKNNL